MIEVTTRTAITWQGYIFVTLKNYLKTEKTRDMLWLGICRKIIIRSLHAEITHV